LNKAGFFPLFESCPYLDVDKLPYTIYKETIMFTLYVQGIPAIKFVNKSDIPARQGNESWRVVDAEGKVIATYR